MSINLLGSFAGFLAGAAGTAAIATALPRYRSGSGLSRAEPVATDAMHPPEADAVIIGGGIAGLATALYLNELGLRAVVLEKGRVAGEQSSRAFGWIYSNGWHPQKLELVNQAKRLWSGYAARFGEDIGYRRTGNFSLATTEAEMAAHEAWLQDARQVAPDMRSHLVRGDALAGLLPGAADRYAGALYQDDDGTIEPQYTVSRLARAAQREGVMICAPCAARRVDLAAGKVAGVHTEFGYVRTSRVVIAAGVWSTLLARQLGVGLPQLGISTSMQRLSAVDGPPGAGYGPDYTWRRHADGEYSLGALQHVAPLTADSFRFFRNFLPALPQTRGMLKLRVGMDLFASLCEFRSRSPEQESVFEAVRVLSGRVDAAENARIRENAMRAFPSLRGARLVESWAGIVDATPDSTPVISDIPDVPGAWLITGFSGNGLSVAPAAGQMLAALMTGGKPACDSSIYRLSRFHDGSDFVFRH